MDKVVIRSIDFETTAKEPENAEIIEIGVTDVVWFPGLKEATIHVQGSRLYDAPKGIPVDVQAVHHIQPHMVAGMPACDAETLKAMALGDMGQGAPTFLVAHNAAYERHWLTPEVCGDVYWIDTLLCAKRLWVDAPAHSNQVLKYYLGLGVLPEDLAMPAHRAGPDTYVTAHILVKMLEIERVSRLVHWTTLPEHHERCPLPKHKNKLWPDIPADYLQWIVRAPEMSASLKYAAQVELDARRAPQSA